MNKDYKISRDQLFETDERKTILKNSEERSIVDLSKGRMTWPVRWMLVHLAMNTGLRVFEIAALRLEDVRLSSKPPYIFVHRGKRGKSRDVYIDRELVKHLKEFIRHKQTWDQSIDQDAPLFSGRGGNPFSTTALHISFKEAVLAAGLRDKLSIHCARHSYATLLYYKTKDLRAVQKQLGHASLNMTTLYADIMPEENSRIANKILD